MDEVFLIGLTAIAAAAAYFVKGLLRDKFSKNFSREVEIVHKIDGTERTERIILDDSEDRLDASQKIMLHLEFEREIRHALELIKSQKTEISFTSGKDTDFIIKNKDSTIFLEAKLFSNKKTISQLVNLSHKLPKNSKFVVALGGNISNENRDWIQSSLGDRAKIAFVPDESGKFDSLYDAVTAQ